MKTILIGQQKGGVGKSTLTGNIAVGLAKRGQRVIIVDTDKQQSCVKWASRRKLNNFQPEVQFATLLAKKGEAKAFVATFQALAASDQYDYCLIDAGGRDNVELRLSMGLADTLIAPTLPSQADIESLEEFDQLVGEVQAINHDLKVFTVLNKAVRGLNFSHEIALARDAILEMEYLNVCYDHAISDRPNFRATWLEGKSIYELDTESGRAGQAEIDGVISWI